MYAFLQANLFVHPELEQAHGAWHFTESCERLNTSETTAVEVMAALSRTTTIQPNSYTSIYESLPVFPVLPRALPVRPVGVFKRPIIGRAFKPPSALQIKLQSCRASSLPKCHNSCIGPCPGNRQCDIPSRSPSPPLQASELLESETSLLLSPPLSPEIAAYKPLNPAASNNASKAHKTKNSNNKNNNKRRNKAISIASASNPDEILDERIPVLDLTEPAPHDSKVCAKQPPTANATERQCISCFTMETPCWRPSWDVNMGQLCNSCGLRYRKTKIRCPADRCRNVPSKMDLATIRAQCPPGKLKCPNCSTYLVRD